MARGLTDCVQVNPQLRKSRISWARLLKPVFNIDVDTCHICRGPAQIIAAIQDPHVIQKILGHLGLPTIPGRIWPARGPPSLAADDFNQLADFDKI